MGFKVRVSVFAIFDMFIITAAVVMAYLLRFDFNIYNPHFALLPYVILAQVTIILAFFAFMKIYHRIWQYASVGELIALLKATTLSEILFVVLHILLQYIYPWFMIPRSIYFLSWVLIMAGVGGSRFAWRIFRDSYLELPLKRDKRRTLIIGAGKAGVLVGRELKQSPESDLYPVGFIDDDQTKWNLEILGLPILGGREHIQTVIEKYQVQNIVIAIPSATRSEIAQLIEICKETKAQIRILPKVADLVSQRVSVSMIREVSVDDLLGRDPVKVDLKEIASYVTEHVVLITGAGGSIGSEISRQVLRFAPKKLLLLGHGENSIYQIENELRKFNICTNVETIIADIQDYQRIREVFDFYRPSVVFHAAAHKHVPLMEQNPVEAVKNNIFGTRNVVECAKEFGTTHFVMISTDKAVNPTSIMGVTKRVAEILIQGMASTSNTKFVAVRFGNVLGSRGSVVPLFKRQIEEGGPVTVTHPDMVRFFMTIPEAVQLVIHAGALAKGGEIFILDMGKPVKIENLARDLIRLSGFEPDKDISITYTGIRPGEKLYEEILTDEEGISLTHHDRIFVGKPIDFSWEKFLFLLKKLEQVVVKSSDYNRSNEVRELLSQIVPTYQPFSQKVC